MVSRIPCIWNMTAPPFFFPFLLLLLCQPDLSMTSQQTKWQMVPLRNLMKNGFQTEAERAAMRVYHAEPTAGLRARHLNNNSDNANPQCLPIRITFFNNTNNHSRRCNDLNRLCTNNRPIRRPVVSAERLHDCRENEEKRAFVQDTWLVEKHAAAIPSLRHEPLRHKLNGAVACQLFRLLLDFVRGLCQEHQDAPTRSFVRRVHRLKRLQLCEADG